MAIQNALAHGARPFSVGSASSRPGIERFGTPFVARPILIAVSRCAWLYFLAQTSYFAAGSGQPPSVIGRNAWSPGMVANSL
jgi:hypothetical protein